MCQYSQKLVVSLTLKIIYRQHTVQILEISLEHVAHSVFGSNEEDVLLHNL